MHTPRSSTVNPPLSEREAAEAINASLKVLRRLRAEGEGPDYLRIGRYVRYRPEAIESWLQDRTIEQGRS